jgi:hypothetical protein
MFWFCDKDDRHTVHARSFTVIRDASSQRLLFRVVRRMAVQEVNKPETTKRKGYHLWLVQSHTYPAARHHAYLLSNHLTPKMLAKSGDSLTFLPESVASKYWHVRTPEP